jgi:protein-disulfide isomerase
MTQAKTGALARTKALLDLLATISVIAAGVAITWGVVSGRMSLGGRPVPQERSRPAAPLPSAPVPIDGAETRGSRNAKVAVIEFSEFECPFCGKFAKESWPVLQSQYVDSGKVLWAFRNLPLEKIHSHALRAAEAGACASEQGRFWQLHDILFDNQPRLDDEALKEYSNRAGLNATRILECLPTREARIRADIAMAEKLGVTGTPAFFLGTVEADGQVKIVDRISGAVPVSQFQASLDKLIRG